MNNFYNTAMSPFWFVTVSVCRRSGLLLIAVSPFWRVADVLICRRFDLRQSIKFNISVAHWQARFHPKAKVHRSHMSKVELNIKSCTNPSLPTLSVLPEIKYK